jgi:hypothetical protein
MKIFFGDNQFLGVNHSDGKGIKYLEKYSTAEEIANTLRDAWDVGIKDFCFTVNHKTIQAICLVVDDCPFNLHPALPYAHNVNNLIAEKGLAKALFYKIKRAGLLNIILAGSKAFFGRYDHAFRLLIASEIEGIPIKNIKSIGLLNIASDFLLGLQRYDLIYSFYRAVDKGFGKKPSFYTMNFPSMADILWGSGYKDCAIVFNLNTSEFRTNPCLNDVLESINKYEDYESIVMSIFSGGKPETVPKLLKKAPKIKGILFGTSKKVNMIDNIKLFDTSL